MADIEQLLYRGESEALDFKREQYRFVGASDSDKAELLKDILAMANAWRDGPAHILLGVDAPTGGPVSVVGIASSLDDAAIQQFVNGKTNRPITFTYRETQLLGKPVGVFEIPVQPRPLYIKSDFVGLKAEKVYIRRGSSTAIALPEEVARMGGTRSLGETSFRVEFADPENRLVLGNSHDVEGVHLTVKGDGKIPDYARRRDSYLSSVALDHDNRDYYRELVEYAKKTALLTAVGITVTNDGDLGAHSVRAEFTLKDPKRDWEFCKSDDFPSRLPSKTWSPIAHGLLDRINAQNRPACDIEYANNTWHLSFDFRDLQPKRTLHPGIPFFVGCRKSGTLRLEGRIFADELPNGGRCELTINAKTQAIQTDLREIVNKVGRGDDSGVF